MRAFKGAILTAEFEIKAADMLNAAGFARLVAEPAFYSLFVVTALSSHGGSIDLERVEFLAVGVIGIQYVRMMTQVIYRWTLERKWSLGSLKLSSGVSQLGYFTGMLCVPLLSLLVQMTCIFTVVYALSSWGLSVHLLPLLGATLLCGLFWSALGCVLTAVITTYKMRDFVVAMMLTPLMFSAPTLYALDQVPGFLRVIAAFNPLTYQLHFLRSAADGQWDVGQGAVVCALTAAMIFIGYVSTSRMRTVSNEG